MKNYWGESDDEPLPDWMNPATYRKDSKPAKRFGSSIQDTIQEALRKPPVPIVIKPPKEDDLK
jgi:hypothetical protein